jgi:drug/metabolite transporter (DMT)-like permease
MINLLGSILFTSYLLLSFKVLERYKLNTFHVIVFNYITCVITGSLVNGGFPITEANMKEPWFPWALLMGVLFIVLFNMIGFTAQKVSVAVASVANKLSMVIPFLFSIFLYKEAAGVLKIAGVVLALIAVYCTMLSSKTTDTNNSKADKWLIILPVILFVGSGLLDTLVKYVEQRYLNAGNSDDYLVSGFFTATVVGLIILFYQVFIKKTAFSFKSIIAGIAIGIPNYFSIWFLVKVLKDYPVDSSKIMPINNMGIVLVCAAGAWLLFKERLSVVNWVGIFLSIAAIALIAYG